MESKRNETFENVIFSTNVIQRLGVAVKKQGRKARGRGRAYPPGRALHPRGPLVAPPTYFFLLYIPWKHHIRSQNPISTAATFYTREIPSWAFFGAPSEG